VSNKRSDGKVTRGSWLSHNSVRDRTEDYTNQYLITSDGLANHVEVINSEQEPKVNESLALAVKFLRPDKLEDGKRVIKDFLRDEWLYCKVLECLSEEYWRPLTTMAVRGAIEMTPEEVATIFRCIPTLFRFHKFFFRDLNRGANIGWMFNGLLSFFNMYLEYTNICALTVKTMQNYVLDKELHRSLIGIRNESSHPNQDMVDLILEPLDRISDYQKLLDQLYNWADQSQLLSFEALDKATRRIGRIAEHIEIHKYGILNKNEMNKAQWFFGKHRDILAPNRVILRRGMMYCKTSRWVIRKKMCMFFLFNDILVWAAGKRRSTKVLYLWHSRVARSSTKKLLLLSAGQSIILYLECASQQERDKWFNAIKIAVNSARNTKVESWTDIETSTPKIGDIASTRRPSIFDGNNTPSVSDGDSDEKANNFFIENNVLEPLREPRDPVNFGPLSSGIGKKKFSLGNMKIEARKNSNKSFSPLPGSISPSVVKVQELDDQKVKIERACNNPFLRNQWTPSFRLDDDLESDSGSIFSDEWPKCSSPKRLSIAIERSPKGSNNIKSSFGVNQIENEMLPSHNSTSPNSKKSPGVTVLLSEIV